MSNRTTAYILVALMAVSALAFHVSAQKPKCSGGPDAMNYMYVTQDCLGGPLYDYVELPSTAQVPLEKCSSYGYQTKMLDIGFEFEFYGKKYSQVMANSIGQLLFQPAKGSSLLNCYYYYSYYGIADCSVTYMCSTSDPNYQIAAHWGLVTIQASLPSSGVYVQTVGPPGDRVFIVQWKDMQACAYGYTYAYYPTCYYEYCCGYMSGKPVDFEVKLFERKNAIEVHHKNSARSLGPYGHNVACVVQGIEGAGNQVGKKWNALSYINAGKGTNCNSVTYTPPTKWAIRYVRNMPPVPMFENYSVPPNLFHNGRPLDDSQGHALEESYFHGTDLIMFQDRSFDDDGTIINWTWDFGDGKPKTALNYEREPRYVYNNESASFPVTLTVTDGYTPKSITKFVRLEPNEPPAIAIQAPSRGIAGQPLQFLDASTDLDGAVDKWYWDFGDNTVSTEQNPKHTYEKAGVYDVVYRASDDDGQEATVKTRLVVEPDHGSLDATLGDPPRSDAGDDRTVPGGTLVKLFGIQANGNAEVYRWTQVQGPAVALQGADGPTPTFVSPVLAPGDDAVTLVFQLVVTNQGRTSEPDLVQVTVSPGNALPRVSVQAPATARPGAEVTLSAAGSTDPEGQPLQFAWTQTLGPAVELTGTGAERTFAAPDVTQQTTLVFEVVATDGATQDAASVAVVVDPAPAMFAVADRGAGRFDFVPHAEGQEYAWDFGDGTTSMAANPSHTYAEEGEYVVTLAVTAFDGTTSTSAEMVAVDLGAQGVAAANPVEARPAAALMPVLAILVLAIVVARRK